MYIWVLYIVLRITVKLHLIRLIGIGMFIREIYKSQDSSLTIKINSSNLLEFSSFNVKLTELQIMDMLSSGQISNEIMEVVKFILNCRESHSYSDATHKFLFGEQFINKINNLYHFYQDINSVEKVDDAITETRDLLLILDIDVDGQDKESRGHVNNIALVDYGVKLANLVNHNAICLPSLVLELNMLANKALIMLLKLKHELIENSLNQAEPFDNQILEFKQTNKEVLNKLFRYSKFINELSESSFIADLEQILSENVREIELSDEYSLQGILRLAKSESSNEADYEIFYILYSFFKKIVSFQSMSKDEIIE